MGAFGLFLFFMAVVIFITGAWMLHPGFGVICVGAVLGLLALGGGK
jgi:hypothetical protein